jgi:hypothetical protein
MVETVQWRRLITKHHTRQSAPAQADGGDFSVILMGSRCQGSLSRCSPSSKDGLVMPSI